MISQIQCVHTGYSVNGRQKTEIFTRLVAFIHPVKICLEHVNFLKVKKRYRPSQNLVGYFYHINTLELLGIYPMDQSVPHFIQL